MAQNSDIANGVCVTGAPTCSAQLSIGISPDSVAIGNTPSAITPIDELEIHTGGTAIINNYRIGGLSVYSHLNNSGPCITLAHSLGTKAVPLTLTNGSNFCRINIVGFDGTVYALGSTLQWNTSETWISTAHGTNIIFNNVLNGTIASQQMLALINDGSIIQRTPAVAPTDANLTNSSISFYLDEAGNNLKVRVKYSSGTLKTATVVLI